MKNVNTITGNDLKQIDAPVLRSIVASGTSYTPTSHQTVILGANATITIGSGTATDPVYSFTLDETNSVMKVYKDLVFLVDIPFGTHSPAIAIDTDYNCPYLDGTYVDIVYTGTNIQTQKFELAGIFDNIQLTTYFDFAVWDSPTYTTELFYVAKGVDGTYTPASLNETNMTFNQTTATATGLIYTAGTTGQSIELLQGSTFIMVEGLTYTFAVSTQLGIS
ncbi:MAG: hypothetical protein WCX83_00185 [Candidatus Cloacimonas sp.]